AQRDTATVALLISGFAVWGTVGGGGPFARATVNESFLLLIVFMVSISVPSLALSAEVAVRRETERQQRLLLAELRHRVKNMLAIVQSIALQTLRGARAPEDFYQTFAARLIALSQAHDLLAREAWQGASLAEVVRLVLTPHGQQRSAVDGPEIR